MIRVGSDFSGVGACNQALKRLGIDYKEVFACDMDKYARKTFIENYGTQKDKEILNHEDYKKVADIFQREFVDSKLKRPTKKDLAYAYANCEFISKSFSFYYPWNVYHRKIPIEPLDIYMATPPCQSFSLAGKRKGEDDERGVLFYDSHEFIQKNKPKSFIFENVKGLLSDDDGRTFKNWINLLGGKSVNAVPVLFPHENAVPYHIYYKVLNAKKHNIPQNRERVFIVGIRSDEDNVFSWPKNRPLTKCLKDVLEENVPEKYFLSKKMINYLVNAKRSIPFTDASQKKISNCILANQYKMSTDQEYFIVKDDIVIYGNLSGVKHEQSSRIYDTAGIAPTLTTMSGGSQEPKIHLYPRIRKLTPRECFRLMDFPDSLSFVCSDSQLYKQAGNSIAVGVLADIISQMKKITGKE